jgi:hypothetical protein
VTLSLVSELERTDEMPTSAELREALHGAVQLNDHPAVQRLLRCREIQREQSRSRLALIRGDDK